MFSPHPVSAKVQGTRRAALRLSSPFHGSDQGVCLSNYIPEAFGCVTVPLRHVFRNVEVTETAGRYVGGRHIFLLAGGLAGRTYLRSHAPEINMRYQQLRDLQGRAFHAFGVEPAKIPDRSSRQPAF
jgi:hypothetical protein